MLRNLEKKYAWVNVYIPVIGSIGLVLNEIKKNKQKKTRNYGQRASWKANGLE